MKRILGLVLVAQHAVAAVPEPAAQPAPEAEAAETVVTPVYVNALAERSRTNNPALRAAGARARAAEAGIEAVRTWTDPTVRLGGLFAEDAMRMEDGDLIYGFEQGLPLFGRSTAARRLATAQLELARADAEFRFQMNRRDLAKALFRAALADRVESIGEQDLSWIEATLATTESRYQVGEGLQAQVLRMQNERARRREQLITDQRRREQSRVALDRLLGSTNAPAWPRFELPPPANEVAFSERLVALSKNSEPRLKVLYQAVAEADAMVGVARRGRYPELAVGAEARNYTRDGDFRQAMVTVSMNLPWLNARRYRSEIRREEARRDAAELDVADYELVIREELHRLVLVADAARREALLYRDQIIPRSEQALTSAETSWTASRALFLEVLEARRLLLEARLMYARAVAEQYETLSELVLCCGLADLEALQMIDAEPIPSTVPQPSPDRR